ncbi:hypothetical protein [Streptomyces sp. CC224B]|uniref:hypothetical protein n=1 Tax=Streptomyces sp. CC224B TaxID=3044571 RepID=UPI0024A85B62|nr:hypothetical protein [Streptomyces sp. CC224B]
MESTLNSQSGLKPGCNLGAEPPLAASSPAAPHLNVEVCSPLPSPACPSLSPGFVLGAPLPELLAVARVELTESSITDRSFFGAVVELRGGEVVLAMPTGRSELERDTMARYLIAQAFGVALPKLSAPFATSVTAH